jgi:hypothetical protein
MTPLQNIILIFILVTGSCLYGIFFYRNKIFPYKFMEELFRMWEMRSSLDYGWAVGTSIVVSPIKSIDLVNIKKPALTALDVYDVAVTSVADPFVLGSTPPYYMFFEAIKKSDQRGLIGLAESENGYKWKYKQVVIDEMFHLSYPYVFTWDNNYYLVPESSEDLSVRIYKAVEFPNRWQYVGNLLNGYHFTDPSLFRYHDTWWMFVSMRESDALNLYYSDDLMGPWIQHPQCPVIRNNRHHSRCAGRILMIEEKLFRFAQDDQPIYGSQVFAFEIIEINRTRYLERAVTSQPLLTASKTGWNSDRMHHIDACQLQDKTWLVAVDGFRKPRFFSKFLYHYKQH